MKKTTDKAMARKARQRKIANKLKRLRKIRERQAELNAQMPLRWKARVKHLGKVAGKLRRELKALGWVPGKKGAGSSPLDETDEQEKDEAEPMPGNEPDEQPEPGDLEADEPADGGNAADEAGAECRCQDPNWIHGDFNLKALAAKVKAGAKNMGKGLWQPAVAVGTQGKLHVRPGQRAMVMPVEPGLFIVQYVPSTIAPASALGDDVGILPLLLIPGIAKSVRKTFEKIPNPAPGQLGHPDTPVIPRPPEPTAAHPSQPEAPVDDAGGRGRRRRRPQKQQDEGSDEGGEGEEGSEEAEPKPRRRGGRGRR